MRTKKRMQNEGRPGSDVAKGAVAGMISGIAAAAVMGAFMALASRFIDEEDRTDEEEAGDEPQKTGSASEQQKEGSPTEETAQAISMTFFGHELKGTEENAAGQAVHYAFGASVGALYGAAAELFPWVTAGSGLPFGAAVWAGADEAALPLVGLSEAPIEMPPAVHLSALGAHLVYGFCTEALRRTIRRRW